MKSGVPLKSTSQNRRIFTLTYAQITLDLTHLGPPKITSMGRLTPFLEQMVDGTEGAIVRLSRRGQAVGKLSRAFDAEAIARTMIAMFQVWIPPRGLSCSKGFLDSSPSNPVAGARGTREN